MKLKDYLRRKIEISIFRVSLLLLVTCVFISFSIFLTRTIDSLKRTLSYLDEAQSKMEKLKQFTLLGEKYDLSTENSVALARLLDSLVKGFGDTQIVLSEKRKLQNIESIGLSLKGQANFKNIIDSLRLIEEHNYPIVQVKSYSLKRKEGSPLLEYELFSEVFLLSGNGSTKSK